MPKTLTTNERKMITKQWRGQFPTLSIYKNIRLFRIVGPLVQGITLDRDSTNTNYLPIFHVHNLGKQDDDFISLTLKQPLLTEKTHYPDKITLSRHEKEFFTIVERFKKQTPLSYLGNLTVKDVIKTYYSYIKGGETATQYPFYEYIDMIHIKIWILKIDDAQKLYHQIKKEIQSWPVEVRSQIDKAFFDYEKELIEMFKTPQLLKEKVESEIIKLGFKELQKYELIG